MSEIVLTKEQMRELKTLGLDISDASMCYVKGLDFPFPCSEIKKNPLFKDCVIEEYAYTLSDILQKIPCDDEGNHPVLCYRIHDSFTNEIVWESGYLVERILEQYTNIISEGKSPMESVFNMLKIVSQKRQI